MLFVSLLIKFENFEKIALLNFNLKKLSEYSFVVFRFQTILLSLDPSQWLRIFQEQMDAPRVERSYFGVFAIFQYRQPVLGSQKHD